MCVRVRVCVMDPALPQVTSAGNYGPNPATIAAPCAAKNTLCVGSSTHALQLIARLRLDGIVRFSRSVQHSLGAPRSSEVGRSSR
jgi:hypothetical protein